MVKFNVHNIIYLAIKNIRCQQVRNIEDTTCEVIFVSIRVDLRTNANTTYTHRVLH